jgi:hypothetical protein
MAWAYTPSFQSQRQTSNAQWVSVGFTALQHWAVVSGTDANFFLTALIFSPAFCLKTATWGT